MPKNSQSVSAILKRLKTGQNAFWSGMDEMNLSCFFTPERREAIRWR